MKLISRQSLVLVAAEILGMRTMNLELIPILCCCHEIHQTTLVFFFATSQSILGKKKKKSKSKPSGPGAFPSFKSLSSADKEGDVQFGVSREILEPSLECKPYRTPPPPFLVST